MQLTLESALVFVVVFHFNTLAGEYVEKEDYFVKEEQKRNQLSQFDITFLCYNTVICLSLCSGSSFFKPNKIVDKNSFLSGKFSVVLIDFK